MVSWRDIIEYRLKIMVNRFDKSYILPFNAKDDGALLPIEG
jgi:hypothetical protein